MAEKWGRVEGYSFGRVGKIEEYTNRFFILIMVMRTEALRNISESSTKY